MTRSRNRRDEAWRPLGELLARDGADRGRLRARLERLDLPDAERALLRDLLERR